MRKATWRGIGALVCCGLIAGTAWAADKKTPKKEAAKTPAETPNAEKAPEFLDFPLKHNIGEDGKSRAATLSETKAWQIAEFVGTGKVRVENGATYLEQGNDMTGITWRGPLARINFEITLEAMRVAGDDFFCGLTFPYKEDPCSLIVGGWGGTVVGISSLDYNDAYNNETARFMTFDKNRWYTIRLRATDAKIEAWIDGKQVVDVETTGRKIGIRWEVEPSVPLGIATWRTTGAIRNVEFELLESPTQPAPKP